MRRCQGKRPGESDQADTIVTCRTFRPLCSAPQLLLDFEKFSLFVITVCEWLHPPEILIQYSHRAHGCRRGDHLMSSLFAQTHEFAVQQTSFKWLSLYLERITIKLSYWWVFCRKPPFYCISFAVFLCLRFLSDHNLLFFDQHQTTFIQTFLI